MLLHSNNMSSSGIQMKDHSNVMCAVTRKYSEIQVGVVKLVIQLAEENYHPSRNASSLPHF